MATSKAQQRRIVYAARADQPDKEAISQIICSRFLALSAYTEAKTVMWYLHCRSEVRTVETLKRQLGGKKIAVIPYCTKDAAGRRTLGLWRLQDLSELVPGTWGILEPPKARWGEKSREVDPERLDLIMVPGVAFDKVGGRLGNGAGYYDRLLSRVRPDCVTAAVCYESQLLPEIAMEPHDVYMDYVLTERATYSGRGR